MVTIGVYGFGGESFLQRLRHADVRLLLDVRQRRGVRGPEYAWANSRRLQAALAQARIAYEHHPELAPLRADGSAASGASPLGFNCEAGPAPASGAGRFGFGAAGCFTAQR
ncbi:uncharacterized protein (DUF488 family) [Streptosporangium album]|uniref:Uncharacterized protein (DUF488 family) n=1 Tax=Streptosporangium album TaxID=47479 RepID=A0A7W7RY29_9ACTN|nr:DUF488 family protein [Streptosporangium album]MBB4940042.1 uncharacterized protein (DUF488 family) [Streptosporangium album]